MLYREPSAPARHIQAGIQPPHADRISNNDTVTSADFSGEENEAVDINQQMLTLTLINLFFSFSR
jgi:hypothetical protein